MDDKELVRQGQQLIREYLQLKDAARELKNGIEKGHAVTAEEANILIAPANKLEEFITLMQKKYPDLT
jgi:hypothetical protein